MIHGETVCFVNKVSSGGRNLLHGPSVSFRFHVSKSDVADFHDFSSNRIEIERRNLFNRASWNLEIYRIIVNERNPMIYKEKERNGYLWLILFLFLFFFCEFLTSR